MTRQLEGGIIRAMCKYCENTEVPDIFALWAGIVEVSAVLGRDSFVDQGLFTVYPNLYVVLVAGSAKCRKSTSIMAAHKIIEKVMPPVNLLSQKLTAEHLIGLLSGNLSKEEKVVIPQSSGTAVADELSTLIDKNAFASGLIALLTRLYDCENFSYGTRGRGIEQVRNPCLTIFGGSTIDWIKESIPIVAIGGGFTSRVIFVYRDEPSKKEVPWPALDTSEIQLREKIIHDLNEVAKLRGAFAFSPQAIELYSKEYRRFRNESKMFANKMLGGYAGRRHIMIIKLAMIVSAAEKDTKVVEAQDVEIAIAALANAEINMPTVMEVITSEMIGDLSDEVLNIIRGYKYIKRADLIRLMKRKMSNRELYVILETLAEARLIEQCLDQGRMVYKIMEKQ